jgi:predicted N-acetyltransferase YhbS
MDTAFLVEEAKPSDLGLIETLLDLSFGIDRRLKTSYRLREGNVAADKLSLVVRDPQVGIAGAISFWPLMIGDAGTPALLLGPLVVNPERQNMGYGLALMNAGLARATAAGHRLIILVGDEPYYARVGFRKLPAGHLTLPGPVNPERFLYLELATGALAKAHGLVLPPHRYHEISAAFARPHQANCQ